jgi:ubiquinone/menaquinone biosynthesis C-methylase UbiE
VTVQRLDPAAVEFANRMDRMNRLTRRLWPGRLRARLLGEVPGRVLDLGAGTGANLPYLRAAAHVVACEPGAAMRALLRTRLGTCPAPVSVVAAAAERLPFPDGSFDAVVCTLVLCSVGDLGRGLGEVRRVLRAGGRLIYAEHVRAHGWWGRVQDRYDERWSVRSAGCHINRDIGAAIAAAGFRPLGQRRIRPLLNTPLSAPLIHGVAVPAGEAGPAGR